MKSGETGQRKKVSVETFRHLKAQDQKIVMVTAYDYPTATIADEAEVDSILVGDSYGMVVLGYESTIPVTVEELLPVCRAVRRGAMHSLLIGDMPFMSFQVSPEQAVQTAGRFVKEGGMESVKIEGGRNAAHVVKAIVRAGIPVLGHIGVTPQTATLHGGYKVQGKTASDGEELIHDAKALEEAGAYGIVLEMVTEDVATIITQSVKIPTIGIGSGRFCDGQVLVMHDILGLYPKFTPRFAKRYADIAGVIRQALDKYVGEVRRGEFPDEDRLFKMDEEQRLKLSTRRRS